MELLLGVIAAFGSILGGVLCLAVFAGIFWMQSIGLEESSRTIRETWAKSRTGLTENTMFGRAQRS